MTNIIRTSSENKDFIELVHLLDDELKAIDGNDHSFYKTFNQIDAIKHVVVLYEDGMPASCGSIKEESSERMAIKRMYTLPKSRGRGFASIVLKELETWAREMCYKKCILETGKRQPEAIQLYKKNDYQLAANYGQYIGISNSLCFEKHL